MRQLFGFVIAGLAVAGALACCMLPAEFKGTISQAKQRGVIIQHEEREDLILSVNYKITAEKMPDRFSWIITVPREPDEYATVSATFFDDIEKWADPLLKIRKLPSRESEATASAPAAGGLEFGKPAKVGPFEIQPIRALAREALDGLNQWLKANGFPTEDPEHMKYFTDMAFTFLCVKVVPPDGGSALDNAGALPGLRVSFHSPRVYYPLKFSSRQGVFDVDLTILTHRSLDYEASKAALDRLGWKDSGELRKNIAAPREKMPKELADIFNNSAFRDYRGGWYVNRVRVSGVNANGALATWPDDLFLETKHRK